MELLMLQFNRGHMTSHMAGQVVGQLWDNIKCKFKIDDQGLYYNERLETEVQKRKTYVQTRSNNLSGVNQYTKKGGHTSGHMDGQLTSHMEDRNRNRNIDRDRSKKKTIDIGKKPYGEFGNVFLSDDEYQKLYVKREDFIERLSAYKKSSGKKYKDDYATILTWMQKDGIQNVKPLPKLEIEEPPRNPELEERMRNLVNQF